MGGPQSPSGRFEEGIRSLSPTEFEAGTVQSLYRLLHPALHKMLPYSAVSLHQYISCLHFGDSSTMHIRSELSMLSNKPTNISA
jgi:hypothetical protein